MSFEGSFPLKNCLTNSIILGILVDPPTRTTSLIYDLDIFASFKTYSTGCIHCLNIDKQSSSNLGLVRVIWKSCESAKASTSIVVY